MCLYDYSITLKDNKNAYSLLEELLTSQKTTSHPLPTDLCSQVVTSGQVFEPEQAVPVTGPPSTWIMLNNLISEVYWLHLMPLLTLITSCSELIDNSDKDTTKGT